MEITSSPQLGSLLGHLYLELRGAGDLVIGLISAPKWIPIGVMVLISLKATYIYYAPGPSKHLPGPPSLQVMNGIEFGVIA